MSHPSSNLGTSRAEAPRLKPQRLGKAVKDEILAEQLSYLLAHAGSCPEDCPDCARLRMVEAVLLQPFRVDLYSRVSPAN